jgi:chorismate-pyruvate lyase
MADTPSSPVESSECETGRTAVERALSLIALFHEEQPAFTDFLLGVQEVAASAVPEPYAGLLAHHSHMTVTMERFHGGPVNLRVIAERGGPADPAEHLYAREILLANGDGKIVQYGIVRIDLSPLPSESRDAILRKGEPLGRILIASGVHRDVQAVELVQLTPGPAFASLLEAAGPTYGRVAEIQLNGRPAVELLEVVPSFAG